MYTIELKRAATKSFLRIPKDIAALIRKRIGLLALDPFSRNLDVQKLQGKAGYRLRVGDYRIIYHLERSTKIITITDILPRGDAYK